MTTTAIEMSNYQVWLNIKVFKALIQFSTKNEIKQLTKFLKIISINQMSDFIDVSIITFKVSIFLNSLFFNGSNGKNKLSQVYWRLWNWIEILKPWPRWSNMRIVICRIVKHCELHFMRRFSYLLKKHCVQYRWCNCTVWESNKCQSDCNLQFNLTFMLDIM